MIFEICCYIKYKLLLIKTSCFANRLKRRTSIFTLQRGHVQCLHAYVGFERVRKFIRLFHLYQSDGLLSSGSVLMEADQNVFTHLRRNINDYRLQALQVDQVRTRLLPYMNLKRQTSRFLLKLSREKCLTIRIFRLYTSTVNRKLLLQGWVVRLSTVTPCLLCLIVI